jgi:signal transduction histidine kinase
MRAIRGQFAILLFGFAAVCACAAYVTPSYDWYPVDRGWDILPITVACALFFGGWWWLRTGRAGTEAVAYSDRLPIAMAMPVLILPIVRYGHGAEDLIAGVLVAAAMVPIGLQFASQVADSGPRRLATVAVVACAALACMEGMGIPRNPYEPDRLFGFFWASTLAAESLVSGLMAFQGRLQGEAGGDPNGPSPVLSDLFDELALIVTPAIACLTLWDTSGYTLWPIGLWLLLLLGRRTGVERLTRALGRTTLQRDLVVSATERERARIAADIHDYALQDLTMLVRRLDAASDTENATAAREVADRLRAICGDLRLPILDDLGVGPALDWLVDRLEPDSERLDLELSDRERRLTPEAELAFFRVAQEAITNAIHHGAPPITVRYWGGGDWAELIVDDVGPGIPAGAAEVAERSGHMGLMSIAQRAETIGAELTFGRRPGGGTRVHMVWEGKLGERIHEPENSLAPAVKREVEPA